MEQLQNIKEVMDSWRRCMDSGLSTTLTSPALHLEQSALKERLKKIHC